MKNVFLSLTLLTSLWTGNVQTKIDEPVDSIIEVSYLYGADVSPTLQSQYAYVYDYTNNQVLLDKASTERMYPASMTKLMSALLLAEHVTDWNAQITITEEMVAGLREANASMVDWGVGAVVDMNALLYGMMLPSGADACYAAAFVVSGNIESFVDLMNQKASELCMKDTHFTNPTGLHDDNHYSTCQDIAKLMKACIDNDAIRTATETYYYEDIAGGTYYSTWAKSLEQAGQSANGLLGGKTGYTEQGMRCFASFGEMNGMKIISVTGHAEPIYSNLTDAATIYNWLSSDYSCKVVLQGEETVKMVTLEHVFGEEETNVIAPSTISYDVENSSNISIDCDIPDTITVLAEDQIIEGTITIYENETVITNVPVQLTVESESNVIAKLVRIVQSLFNK